MSILLDFAELLKTHRNRRGWGQLELQDAVAAMKRGSVSFRTISDIERHESRRPQPATIELLADAFGLRDDERRYFILAARGQHVPPPQGTIGAHNLPLAPDLIEGRDRDRDAIVALLAPSTRASSATGRGRAKAAQGRLVTILGPAGVGKSTVALAVARVVIPLVADGIWHVDIDPDRTTASALAALLGDAGGDADPGDAALARQIGGRAILLVLDGCERSLREVRALAATLLGQCPHLQILATSRRPLGLPGERCRTLSPLAHDTPPGGSPNPAVRLFLQRARISSPLFDADRADLERIATICRELDGLPGGIIRAADRLAIRDLAGVAEDLDEIRAALVAPLARDHAALSAPERTLLEQIALGEDGVSFTLLRAIASGEGWDPPMLVAALEQLATGSWIATHATDGERRYDPGYLVRWFVRRRLIAEGREGAVRRGQCDGLITLATGEIAAHGGPAGGRWRAALDPERRTVRAALTWASTHDPARGLALAARVWPTWFGRGSEQIDGVRRLGELLRLAPEDAPARGRAHYGRAVLTVLQDTRASRVDIEAARRLAAEAGDREFLTELRWAHTFVALYDDAVDEAAALIAEGWAELATRDDPAARTANRMLEGYLAIHRGRLDAGHEMLTLALAEAEAADQPIFACMILSRLGDIDARRGRTDDAMAEYAALASVSDRAGADMYRLVAAYRLGVIHEAREELDDAERAFSAYLTLAGRGVGNRFERALSLLGLGRIALRRDQAAVATRQLGRARELAAELGHQPLLAQIALPLGVAEWRAGRHDRAIAHLDDALVARADTPAQLAIALEQLAPLAIGRGQAYLAAQWLGFAAAARERAGTPAAAAAERELRALTDRLLATLGTEEATAAQQQGRYLATEDVIEHARAWLLGHAGLQASRAQPCPQS